MQLALSLSLSITHTPRCFPRLPLLVPRSRSPTFSRRRAPASPSAPDPATGTFFLQILCLSEVPRDQTGSQSEKRVVPNSQLGLETRSADSITLAAHRHGNWLQHQSALSIQHRFPYQRRTDRHVSAIKGAICDTNSVSAGIALFVPLRLFRGANEQSTN